MKKSTLMPRRRAHVLAIAAIAVSVVAATSATPAVAGTTAHHSNSVSFCDPLSPEAKVFSGLDRLLASSSTARGGQAREPNLNQTLVEVPASAQAEATSGAVVPTWVHVVTPDGVTGNVPLRKIREQITVLDLAFGGFYGGADTGFDFELAGVTRTVNAAWYNAAPSTRAERDMKKALHRGGANTLNMYLTTASAYLGWAYFPSIVDSNQAFLDGIVVDWESLPGTSDAYEGTFDLGGTAPHEVGHWLNLYHTFQSGCGNLGDRVDDTPAQNVPTSGCPEGKDSCEMKPGLDPIHNYMDYSYDACYTEFTAGQSQRMNDAWNFWRAGG